MCTVSAILDQGRQMFPDNPIDDYLRTWGPSTTEIALNKIFAELEKISKFMELVAKAKEFDTLTNQPDCEDPEKLNLIKDLENRIAALEAQLKAIHDAFNIQQRQHINYPGGGHGF